VPKFQFENQYVGFLSTRVSFCWLLQMNIRLTNSYLLYDAHLDPMMQLEEEPSIT